MSKTAHGSNKSLKENNNMAGTRDFNDNRAVVCHTRLHIKIAALRVNSPVGNSECQSGMH